MLGEKIDIIEKVEEMKGGTEAGIARDMNIADSSLIWECFSSPMSGLSRFR